MVSCKGNPMKPSSFLNKLFLGSALLVTTAMQSCDTQKDNVKELHLNGATVSDKGIITLKQKILTIKKIRYPIKL
jgi:hypothetical protein